MTGVATVDAGDVAARVSEVRRRIAAAGGESYADELVAKHARVGKAINGDVTNGCTNGDAVDGEGSRWHFLGRVQRNKVRRLAPFVHTWQAVERYAAAQEIARRAPGARVLVQVNVSGEPQKNGCALADAPELVDGLRGLELDVVGLMAVGPAGPPDNARYGYRQLAAMADLLELPERSMGMTDDLEVAVEEGTTMVRVGRALFGARSVPTDLRR